MRHWSFQELKFVFFPNILAFDLFINDFLVPNRDQDLFHSELTLTDDSIWFPSSKVNVRRVIEAGFHLLNAGMLEEAVNEFCRLEMVCASVFCNQLYELITHLLRLSRLLTLSNDSSSIIDAVRQKERERVNHYLRWLQRSSSLLDGRRDDPRLQITLSAASEPSCSQVKQDLLTLCAKDPSLPRSPSADENLPCLRREHDWIRSVAFNGRISFDPLLLDLRNHSFWVFATLWSPDGKMIASESEILPSNYGTVRVEKCFTHWRERKELSEELLGIPKGIFLLLFAMIKV